MTALEQGASRPTTDMDRVAERWADAEVALAPEYRVELGLPGDTAEYSDLSPASFDARRSAVTKALAEVQSTDTVDEIDEVTKLELVRVLELELEQLDARIGYRDMNNIACPAQNGRMIFDLMSQESAEDFDAIARRMANLPAYFEGYKETLRAGAAEGNTAAKRQVHLVIEQTEEYAKQGGFFDQLAEGKAAQSVADDSLKRALVAGAEKARVAYAELADFLKNEYLDKATEADGVGREHYSLASRGFLGAKIDLDETYEWGLEELARMRAEQEAIANEILPGATVQEAIAHLEQDTSRKLIGTEALREWMQRTSDQAVANLAKTHFDIPEPMQRLECMIAPTQEGAIYYTGPSDDFSRPGRMWWSVTPDTNEFDTWRELTTVYHEGVPGHHLQIARATYVKDQLNAWRRRNWTSGHGEGWALYAERLMEQLGYLDDPADRLGMLDGQRMRAARVALDIGVHLGKEIPEGGKTWEFEYALNFMRENVNMPDGFIQFETNRYFGWPGQAPAYKIGQRIWEEVRAESERRAGADFDLKAWHTKALNLGGVGLDTLKQVLLGE